MDEEGSENELATKIWEDRKNPARHDQNSTAQPDGLCKSEGGFGDLKVRESCEFPNRPEGR